MFSIQSLIFRGGRLVSRSDGRVDVLSNMRAVACFRVLVSWVTRHFIVLTVLAVFVLAGICVLDDYGVGRDYEHQRKITVMYLDYVLFGRDFTRPKHDMFYGLSFELPLLLLERGLGLDDTRDIHLMRHVVTHLFFLTGSFFCYLLAYRLFGSRLLALFATLLFLLHPRIYAHSFFNSKDVPFLSMFMICMYMTHRAFDRRDVRRFLILGVAFGVLINLRIMGVTLFVLVVCMQILDLLQASRAGDRRRVLATAGVLSLSCVATLYAVSPHLWGDPFGNSIEWFTAFSQHPTSVTQMFRGDVIISTDINRPEYVPVWMTITTPPAVLVLVVVGMSVVLLRGLINPSDVFMNTRLRFWFMLAGCFVLSVVAVVILDSNFLYGWRQMYFLHALLCLLAMFGVNWMTSMCNGLHLSVLSRLFNGKTLMYGAVIASIIAAVVAIVSIHPHQHLHFNFMVDRTTPEHLRSRYDVNYWHMSLREGFEHLLESHPSTSIHLHTSSVPSGKVNKEILAEMDRERLILDRESFDFYITNYQWGTPSESTSRGGTSPLVYSRVIYGNNVLGVAAVNLSLVDDVVATRYREVHNATVSGKPAARSEWDIYVGNATLVYIKESCLAGDFGAPFFLHVIPDNIDDLPKYRRRGGHATRNFDFEFGMYGVMFEGKCMAVVPLPDDGITGIRTGQWTSDGELWEVAVNMRSGGARAYRSDYESVIGIPPATSSDFDTYIRDGRLVYVRDSCDVSDVEAEFFLHVVPSDVSDLPPPRREFGFDNLDFVFETHGLMIDGMCIASIGLPDYEIERIRTGQWDPEQQRDIWKEEFDVGVD